MRLHHVALAPQDAPGKYLMALCVMRAPAICCHIPAPRTAETPRHATKLTLALPQPEVIAKVDPGPVIVHIDVVEIAIHPAGLRSW